MISRNTHAAPQSAQAADRSPWRMDPPAPNGLQDLLLGAWPGALVGLVLLGLLLAFGNVVRDGVRRGDQLRSQMTSASWRCEAQAPQSLTVQCADSKAPALARSEQTSADTQVGATPALIRQP